MITYVSVLHVSAHKRAILREGHTKTYTKEGTIKMNRPLSYKFIELSFRKIRWCTVPP